MLGRLSKSGFLASGAMLIAATACAGEDAAAKSPARSSCGAVEYRQLDFRIGEFEVAGMEGVRAGDSRVESILDGCMLVEHWRGAISGQGQAFFYYDRSDQRWHMTFLNDEGDALVMDGTFDGDTLVLRGTGGVAGYDGLQRMAWSPLPEGGTRQFWEFSSDHGVTWRTIHIGHYARRR